MLKRTFASRETAESLRDRSEDAWEPDWIRSVFTAWAQCSNKKCGETFALSGSGQVEWNIGPEGEDVVAEQFEPLFCTPMPDIIEMPAKCPSDIHRELRLAFTLFWSSPAASAGRLRVVIEKLMDLVGVPTQMPNKKGKVADLTLHARLELYGKKNPGAGKSLMALKWIGNTGSHDSTVSREDLLDSLELIEHVLGEIVGERSKRMASIAKKLTDKHRRKGP